MKGLTILFVLFSGMCFGQTDTFKPQILKADVEFQKLLNSPECQDYSSYALVVKTSFWYNAMPMTTDRGLLWHVSIVSVDYSGTDFLPNEIKLLNCYLFYGESVYSFAYNGAEIADKSLNIPGRPDDVVVKYLDVTDNTIKYIRKKGPFDVQTVY